MKSIPAALTLISALSAGTALAGTAPAGAPQDGGRTYVRVSCSQYGSLVFSDEKTADDASASSDWRERISRSFPKAICVSVRRVGGIDAKYRPFGALPDTLPPPEPPSEPPVPYVPQAKPAPAATQAAPGGRDIDFGSLPLQSNGAPGAPVDDTALRAALSAIGLKRGQQSPGKVVVPQPEVQSAPAPTAVLPQTAPPAPTPARTAAVEQVTFADGQSYATGGYIVTEQAPAEHRDTGRRTVLAGMVFAEPGQASYYADPGMRTGGVMVAEIEPPAHVETVAAAAAIPESAIAAPAAPASAPSVMVQLASFSGWERSRMEGVWRQISGKAVQLAGLEPRILRIGGTRTYTALRVGPLDEAAAKDLAKTLGEKGMDSKIMAGAPTSMIALASPADH